MRARSNLKSILIVFLKWRIFFVFLLLTELFLHSNRYIDLIDASAKYRYFLFNLFRKYKTIQTASTNFLILLDGKFKFLVESFLSAFYFLSLILCIHFSINYFLKKKSNSNKIKIIFLAPFFIGGCNIIYWSLINKYSIFMTFGLTFLILFIYVFDFLIFDFTKLLKFLISKHILSTIFTFFIFLSEIICTPLYIKFIHEMEGCSVNKKTVLLV